MTHVNVIFFILHFEYLERPLYVDNFFSDESSIPSKKDGAFVRSRACLASLLIDVRIEDIRKMICEKIINYQLRNENNFNIVRISKLFKKNVFH